MGWGRGFESCRRRLMAPGDAPHTCSLAQVSRLSSEGPNLLVRKQLREVKPSATVTQHGVLLVGARAPQSDRPEFKSDSIWHLCTRGAVATLL